MSNPVYEPKVFDHADLKAAMEIVLTPENNVSTDIRWQTETPWLLNILSRHTKSKGVVLDFGCGVGRMSQPLAQMGHKVIGLDQSLTMRTHATQQVASPHFAAVSPEMLDQLVSTGLHADIALAIWVLQHTLNLDDEIDRLYRSMAKGAVLLVADMKHRAVPTNQGWVNDGRNVKNSLSARFQLLENYPFNPPNAPVNLVQSAFVAVFYKP